jgi:hypothetical protein
LPVRFPLRAAEITARVASVQDVNAWTKAGVMVRNGLGAGAAHAFTIQTQTTPGGLSGKAVPSHSLSSRS